jgi:hypothetical protein
MFLSPAACTSLELFHTAPPDHLPNYNDDDDDDNDDNDSDDDDNEGDDKDNSDHDDDDNNNDDDDDDLDDDNVFLNKLHRMVLQNLRSESMNNADQPIWHK